MTYFAAPGIIKSRSKRYSLENIESIVCKYFDIDKDIIHTNKRSRQLVECRGFIYFLARNENRLSLSEIASYYGKHHTTVIHGIRLFQDLYDTQESVRKDLEAIKEMLTLNIFL